MITQSVIINSRKYDGKVHRSWKAELIDETDEYWLFFGKFETEINHPKLGVIRRNTVSYEYYWKNRWFNVFRFHEPDGNFRNFYCNINLPPVFAENVLDYVDLDIDLLVWKDFSIEVLDRDEFEQNARLYKYPDEIAQKCLQTLNELYRMIEFKAFPFSETNDF